MKAFASPRWLLPLCVGMTTVAASARNAPTGSRRDAAVRRNGWNAPQGHHFDPTHRRSKVKTNSREVSPASSSSSGNQLRLSWSPDEATRSKMMDLQSKQAAENPRDSSPPISRFSSTRSRRAEGARGRAP